MSEQAYEVAREKAEFCLKLGIAPSEYDQLTQIEVNAFIEVWNEINKKR